MMRARLPLLTLAVLLALAAACRARPAHLQDRKLVILGFDGLDPDLLERWMAAGRLPTFAALAAQGGFHRLETVTPPESLVAWTSFATGVEPGAHGIFATLARDPGSYQPSLGLARVVPGRRLFDAVPIAAPRVESLRGGVPFWTVAGQAGVRSSVLAVPGTFPPEDVPNGELLSGLPLPDVRGELGAYQYYATDLAPEEEGRTRWGGILRRLSFENDRATTELSGPPGAIWHSTPETSGDLALPMRIRWNRLQAGPSVTIELQDRTYLLQPGQWTRWIPLRFRTSPLTGPGGMVQLHLAEAGRRLRLYASPINWDPARPPVPMSYPSSFASDLQERLGTYRTLGWPEATPALDDGRMDEKTFIEDLYRAFDDRAQIILNRLGRREWNLLVGVVGSTDRVQHMMWRLIDHAHPMYDEDMAISFGSAIERVYRRADQLLAQVLEMIEPDTPLLVVSAHGFHSWRRAVHLNTWLAQEGYLTLRAESPVDRTLPELYAGGPFWEHVDWSRTRAYAMGFGQIYLNLRAREAHGIVQRGAEADALADEIADRLRALSDPRTGLPVVRSVHRRGEGSTRYGDRAPDLQVGFADGYRVSWQTAIGGAPPGVIADNLGRWSGDHGGFDAAETPGVLVTNRRLAVSGVRLVDIAPTVLQYFRVPLPAALDGRPVF